MPTHLISIGRSGAAASRAALEVSAQNIANAGNPDYVRRTLTQSELVGFAIIDSNQSTAFSGVEIGGIRRPEGALLQQQVRNSGADLARVEAELSGLRDAETALEQSRLYEGLVDFESALTLLESDPTDPALRTGALETARQLASTFQFADATLSAARDLAIESVNAGIAGINGSASELAGINLNLINSREGTAGRAALLDARDAALRELADEVGIDVSFDEFGAVEVRLKSANAPLLVSGVTAETMSVTTQTDGSISFAVGTQTVEPTSGAMAGRSAAIEDIITRQADLDNIAALTISRANAAQAAGSSLDGSPGQPLFSGSTASDIAIALSSGDGLALAPAGAPPGSRDTSNLGNLIAAFGATDGPIAATDATLLSLSSRIAGLETTREGLSIINQTAEAELRSATGVDLDAEAANLVRLQQAFQANSRVIQVASELFDTILGLR